MSLKEPGEEVNASDQPEIFLSDSGDARCQNENEDQSQVSSNEGERITIEAATFMTSPTKRECILAAIDKAVEDYESRKVEKTKMPSEEEDQLPVPIFPRNVYETLTSLELKNCSLNQLNHLPQNTKDLDISWNSFEKLPHCVLHLDNLESLNVSHNLLCNDDEEKPSTCNLKSLKKVDLSYNKLLATPWWLVKLRSLRELEVKYNTMGDSVAEVSGRLLRHVFVENISLPSFPTWVLDFKDVLHLRIGNESKVSDNFKYLETNLIKAIPSGINGLKWLDTLDMANLDLRDLPSQISELKHLSQLYLRGNHFDHLPDAILRLEKLRVLDISYNIVFHLPRRIATCKALTELHVAHNRVLNVPDDLDNLENLHLLDLYYNRLPCREMKKLVRIFDRLSSLDVHENNCEPSEVFPDKTTWSWSNTYLTENLREMMGYNARNYGTSRKASRVMADVVSIPSTSSEGEVFCWDSNDPWDSIIVNEDRSPGLGYGRLEAANESEDDDDEWNPRNDFGFRYPRQIPSYDFFNLHLDQLNLGPHVMIPSDLHAKKAMGKWEMYETLLELDRKLTERYGRVPGRRLRGIKYNVVEGQFDDCDL